MLDGLGDSESAMAAFDELMDFVEKAAHFTFCLSSDYKMEKHVFTWNKSPQLGPRYFFLKRTQYVDIFCIERCGKGTVPPRLNRNIFFVHDVSIGGSKTSDDTITLCLIFF